MPSGMLSAITRERIVEETRTGPRDRSDVGLDRAIIAALREPLLLLDGELRVLSANRSFYRMMGATPDQIEGRLFCDLGGGEWSNSVLRQRLGEIIPSNTSLDDVRVEFDSSDLGRLTFLLNARLLDRESGQSRLILVAIEDVTEKELAREALIKSEEFTRAVVDSLATHVAVVGESGEIVMVNCAWSNFAKENGGTESAVGVGANYFDVCEQAQGDDAQTAGVFTSAIRDVLKGKREVFNLEYACHSPNQKRWFIGKVMRLRARGPRRVVISHQDISLRVISEEARRESESVLRSVFDAAPICMGVVELEHDDIRVVSSNPATAKYLGVEPEALRGKRAGELGVPRSQIDRWREKLLESERSGAAVHFDDQQETTLGSRRMSNTVCHLGTLGPNFPRFAYLSEDFTDRIGKERVVLGLNSQLELRLNRLLALRKIDMAITVSMDKRLTLGVIMEQAVAQLGVEAADVLLCDEQGEYLEFAAGLGLRTVVMTQVRQPLERSVVGSIPLDGRPRLVIELRQTDPTFFRAAAMANEGFVSYAVMPLVSKGQVKGVLEVFGRTRRDADPEWSGFLETLAGQAAIAVENSALFEGLRRTNSELKAAYDATIEGWARALDLRDQRTEGHSRRVTEMTVQLAKAMGVPEGELVHIRRGALLHDIGKMAIPDAILLKPGSLDGEERAVIQSHPALAVEMLCSIAFLRPALEIPYCHHERWDGGGYPRGLRREQIPRSARIFAAVDIWDALSHGRPYRDAWSHERVLEHIRSLSGTHLDPNVVARFLSMIDQIR